MLHCHVSEVLVLTHNVLTYLIVFIRFNSCGIFPVLDWFHHYVISIVVVEDEHIFFPTLDMTGNVPVTLVKISAL